MKLIRPVFWGVVLLSPLRLPAQELYPNTEPASNFPTKTIGLRIMSEWYDDGNGYVRNMNALRLMYGLAPRLSVSLTAAMSNHHKQLLPEDYPYHNTPERGVYKPYEFNGISAYAKYRFLSKDEEKSHLRMAVYAEASTVSVAHDEGEPRLLDDTKGFGFGYIGTWLQRKFAASITLGAIFPGQYKGAQPDVVRTMPDIPTRVRYGNAINYSLSMGYLLLPKTYRDYRQANLNVYLELMGKYYGDTKVWVRPQGVPEYLVDNALIPPALRKGFYMDIVPGLQLIINSNTRIDFSVNFKGWHYSYARLYPQFNIGLQHYFYL